MEKEAPARETLLNTSLADLEGCLLHISCCKGVVIYPVKLIAASRGGGLRLSEAIARLRCSKCRGKPAQLALLETNLTDGKGRTLGWTVELDI